MLIFAANLATGLQLTGIPDTYAGVWHRNTSVFQRQGSLAAVSDPTRLFTVGSSW